jgi:transposase InsO family protein
MPGCARGCGTGQGTIRGFRLAYHYARAEGWQVNHKKVQRLCRDEGLRVPQRLRRKRLGASTAANPPTADAANVVWAVDFQFDATTDGRPIKIDQVAAAVHLSLASRLGFQLADGGRDVSGEDGRVRPLRSVSVVDAT